MALENKRTGRRIKQWQWRGERVVWPSQKTVYRKPWREQGQPKKETLSGLIQRWKQREGVWLPTSNMVPMVPMVPSWRSCPCVVSSQPELADECDYEAMKEMVSASKARSQKEELMHGTVDLLLWGNPAALLWGTQASLERLQHQRTEASCWEPAASWHKSESPWKGILHPQPSLQVTVALVLILTTTSSRLLSQNQPVKLLLNSWPTKTVW